MSLETNEPEFLTREEMNTGMRVMLPDGSMRGKVTDVNKKGFAVHFDNTRAPMEYDWRNGKANFLVKEE